MTQQSIDPKRALAILCAILFATSITGLGSTFAPTQKERTAGPELSLRGTMILAALPRKIDELGRTYVQLGDMLFVLKDGAGIESAFTGERWPGGIVHYVFDSSVSSAHRQDWLDAAGAWSAVAPVTFVQGTGAGNYIRVQNGSGNDSYVGMIGGPQNMHIYNWTLRYVIAHEIGHALGAEHEHQRSDRDSNIMIALSSVQHGYADQFELESSINYGTYDFDSLMHYDKCAFSIDCPNGGSCACSNYTIVVLPPNDVEWQDAIGQLSHLSELDGIGMAQRYGQLSAPAGNLATNITSNGFTANWSTVTGATGYRLDVSTTNTFINYLAGYQDLDVGNVTSLHLNGLIPNTTYYYRSRAYNNLAASDNSNIVTALTAPAAPVASAATNVATNSFSAHWNLVSGAITYHLDVSTSSEFNSYVNGFQNLDVGNVISGNVAGLSAGTICYYRVRGSNGFAESDNSNVITVVMVPAPPTASSASDVTSAGFAANWTFVEGATGYRLDVSTDNSFTDYLPGYHDLDVGNVTIVNVGGLSTNTTYYYRVRAYNIGGTSGSSNTIAILTGPSAPAANAPTNVTANSFTANWSSVSGAAGYRIDVSTSISFGSYVSGYQDLDVGNVNSQNITGLSPGGTYYYRVRTRNSGGSVSDNSNVVTVTIVPAAPIATAASGVSSRGFSANWNMSTGAIGYRLDVATNSSFTNYVNGYQNRDVANVSSFTVKGVSANTTCYYRVRAYNTNGLTGASNVITVVTATPPSPTPRPSSTPK